MKKLSFELNDEWAEVEGIIIALPIFCDLLEIG